MIRILLQAITAFLNAWSLFAETRLHKEIDEIEDEIFGLGISGTPADKLRIEQLAKRRERISERVGTLRSPDDHTDKGD